MNGRTAEGKIEEEEREKRMKREREKRERGRIMKVKLDETEKEEICQGRGKIRQKIETKGMMGGSLEF